MRLEDMGEVVLPPNDIEAEKAILGAVLIDDYAIEVAKNKVGSLNFYLQKHRDLFSSMVELSNNHEPADLLTLCSMLTEKQLIDAVGGIGYLQELVDCVATAKNIEYDCAIVVEKSLRRALIVCCTEFIAKMYDPGTSIETEAKVFFEKMYNGGQHNDVEVRCV